MIKLGILASSRGTNFQAIIDACASGRLDAKPVIAISNNSRAIALARARDAGIPVAHLSGTTHPDERELDAAITKTLTTHEVDLVITAGYMKKLGPLTLTKFSRRIINVHPSLLPRHGGKGMYGINVHRAVIESGDHETGITIHYVNGEYDTGPIIAQKSIPVLPSDTPTSLADRVLAEEHKFLIDTLASIIGPKT
ncbi:MAG: phosphoribosylglycinamide formyltransferase [Pseudomonadales bacterium]